MLDFEKPLEPQVSEIFFNGKDVEDCPKHAVELTDWINVRVLENYFRNVWTPNWANYRYSNEGVAFKSMLLNQSVLLILVVGIIFLKVRLII